MFCFLWNPAYYLYRNTEKKGEKYAENLYSRTAENSFVRGYWIRPQK